MEVFGVGASEGARGMGALLAWSELGYTLPVAAVWLCLPTKSLSVPMDFLGSVFCVLCSVFCVLGSGFGAAEAHVPQ